MALLYSISKLRTSVYVTKACRSDVVLLYLILNVYALV